MSTDTPSQEPKCPIASTQPTCPVDHTKLNPLNQIPENLSNEPLDPESASLPQTRETSSIPNQSSEKWEYPSPQQFYNALRRKGFATPQSEIPIMVDIHNYLNEQAWNQILEWENMHPLCKTPKLVKLIGRPNSYSPKSTFSHYLFGTPRPFDRHDWYVDRCGTQVRYVIDYYSGPDEPNDTPVFFLDVRPALDSPTAALDRMRVAFRSWMSSSQK